MSLEFSFSLTDFCAKSKEGSLLNYIPIAGKNNKQIHAFSKYEVNRKQPNLGIEIVRCV